MDQVFKFSSLVFAVCLALSGAGFGDNGVTPEEDVQDCATCPDRPWEPGTVVGN